jgi:pimeloyl-ACP methyl ester carboxylesterase
LIAVDRTKELIIVSFQGTQNLGNLLANFNLGLTPIDICPGCSAHAGFYEAWTTVRADVIRIVLDALVVNRGFRVVSTGHSLGGGLATLAGAELRKHNIIVDVVRFSPTPDMLQS